MSRDVVEENRVGQRSSELPWFWRLDRKLDKDRGEFVKECGYDFSAPAPYTDCFLQSIGLTGFVQRQERRDGRRN